MIWKMGAARSATIPKYLLSDDGKTVDGKIVVFILPDAAAAPEGGFPGPAGGGGAAGSDVDSVARSPGAEGGALAKGPRASALVAAAQAAAMKSASERGAPFCEDCENARRELAARRAR